MGESFAAESDTDRKSEKNEIGKIHENKKTERKQIARYV